jgi:S-DNA-T family DNA segregation ATPase FtsK/SpoIIIE
MSINTILSNPYILAELTTAIDAQSGNVATVTGSAPIVVSPTAGNCVVSLPIAGAYSASNNVVKGSSATALVWGSDGDSLTFSAPLLDTAGVVSLPISGTWAAGSNDIVIGSSATALAWGAGSASGVASVTASAPVTVTGTASAPVVNLPISGTWAAGSNDIVVGSSATALAWGAGSASGVASVTASAPVTVTGTASAPVVNLPIAGTWAAGTNDVVKGSSATALVWGPDAAGTVYTGTAPITVTGSVIAITDGPYLLATAGALTLDITGPTGTAGQVLSLSTTPGSLAWANNPASTTTTNLSVVGPASAVPFIIGALNVLSLPALTPSNVGAKYLIVVSGAAQDTGASYTAGFTLTDTSNSLGFSAVYITTVSCANPSGSIPFSISYIATASSVSSTVINLVATSADTEGQVVPNSCCMNLVQIA